MLDYEGWPPYLAAGKLWHHVRLASGLFIEKTRPVASSLQKLISRFKDLHLLTTTYHLEKVVIDLEHSQAVLDSISEAVATTDFRGHIVYLNKAAERLTGSQQRLALNCPFSEIFSVIDAASGLVIGNLATEAIIGNAKTAAPNDSLLKRRDGTVVPVEVSSTPVHDRRGGISGAVIVARDMTVLRESSKKLLHLALHDHLTELPNRTLLANRLNYAISRAKRTEKQFAVLFIDLDNFKNVNDTLGHEAGDQLLQMAAERLQDCVRRSDTVSRYGGDEFIAILDECSENDAVPCAADIVGALSKPYQLKDQQVCLSSSIGIAIFPTDGIEGCELIRAADLAMYRVKRARGGGFHRYDSAPDSAMCKDSAVISGQ